MEERRIRINHRGKGLPEISIGLDMFFKELYEWTNRGEAFHIDIDYDPEWTLLISFRTPKKEETESLEAIRPTKEEMEKFRAL